MTEFLEIAIKISIIVAMGLLVTTCLRHRAAALRHWILAVTFACAATLPLLEQLVPSWYVALPTRSVRTSETQTPPGLAPSSALVSITVGPLHTGRPAASESVGWTERLTRPNVVIAVWTAGFAVSLAVLIVGGMRLSRIASRSRRLAQGRWVVIADEVRRAYRLRRPVVVLQSTDPRLLVTWGLITPKVILPARAAEWTEDRVRLVLSHELAHARRADWIVQLGAEVLRAVYWFNPLMWVACARLRQESEKACDDVVLCRGVDGAAYAAHLVQIARELGQRRIWMPAPAIARTSSLERRSPSGRQRSRASPARSSIPQVPLFQASVSF
jgi:beta-lactamase regulating signal transducer with metallopeptidase domain